MHTYLLSQSQPLRSTVSIPAIEIYCLKPSHWDLRSRSQPLRSTVSIPAIEIIVHFIFTRENPLGFDQILILRKSPIHAMQWSSTMSYAMSSLAHRKVMSQTNMPWMFSILDSADMSAQRWLTIDGRNEATSCGTYLSTCAGGISHHQVIRFIENYWNTVRIQENSLLRDSDSTSYQCTIRITCCT